jgi:hypothetical protein
MGVEGLGQAKADKYAAVFLAAIGSSSSVATDSPL